MRQTRTRWRLHVALFLGVGLAATGVGLVAYGTNVFRELELDTVDARFSIRGEQRPPENVEVVAIDDITFSSFNSRQENVRYPFPRRYFARVIDRLAADGAKVIAYDIQFTEQTDPENDNALVQSVADARNVVLATTEVDARGGTNVFGGDEVVRQVGARVGNGNFPLDPGGVIRRVAYSVDKLKSFSLVAAERATGKTIGKNDFPGGSTWIDYSGPALTIKPFSFSDVYYGRVPKGSFRDKIVVVGPSAVALQDIHPTSTDNAMSGAEIQASAINTALRDFPLRSVPGELTLALIILLGLLAPVASLRLTLLWTLALGVAAAAAYLVATQAAFEAGHVLSFIYPFGTLVASVVGALGAHYLLAAFERERVREVFSRFVPETVVEQVLARADEDLRLGGVTLEGTAMFTDLRGFTTFAESLPAARVIEVLNVYLSEMSEAIMEHGGTLVAYMGDGIFAVYGAPIEQADHADRALATAREMLTLRLPRVNAWLREQGMSDGFRMGIGLNSGPFMSGNVGSERRLEYAAIGDTTNTAARLEGMTKGQTHFLFFSDTTREALTNDVDDLVFVDEFEVRGRQGKVRIWSVEEASVEAFEAGR
ncbi:MAG TPA: adenylate/guanylate cyclase domain-containing protein [Gaiellaceae bacterium]|jgi:adenylate cyclase|nr:adenylate/guanylate cyclase domain-containing protein [Gaiellaceae bacterium]